MKVKLNLITVSDCQTLVNDLSKRQEEIYFEDGKKQRVRASSLLGALCSLEWDEVYLCCDTEIPYHLYSKYAQE